MSMLNNIITPRVMVGAAIVGIVGAAGMFIYEQVYAEKRRAMLVSEVARLDRQVTSMRSELTALRELQKEAQLRRLKHKNSSRREKRKVVPVSGDAVDAPDQSDSEYFTDYQSLTGTDIEGDSEEFYDVNTDEDEDDTLRDSVRNGHATAIENLDEDSPDKADPPKSTPKNTT